MDVLPPPDCPPVNSTDYPQIPTRTSHATLQKLHDVCISGNIQKFRQILDSRRSSEEEFDLRELSGVMVQATKRNSAQFIKELLHRGMPVDPLYVLEAIKMKAKDASEAFLDNGWDINQPISELNPPVLG